MLVQTEISDTYADGALPALKGLTRHYRLRWLCAVGPRELVGPRDLIYGSPSRDTRVALIAEVS